MEPPPGPAGRELKARAMRAKEEAAAEDAGNIPVTGEEDDALDEEDEDPDASEEFFDDEDK